MKNKLLLYLLLFSIAPAFCQLDVSQQSIGEGSDVIYIYQAASFNLGGGITCPKLQSHNLIEVEDTILLELYYDVGGIWPGAFCTSYDTVSIPKATLNYCDLKVRAISYFEDIDDPRDTLYDASINLFEVCQYTSVNDFLVDSSFDVFPNPVYNKLSINNKNAIKISSIKLYSIYGRVEKVMSVEEGNDYNLEALSSGAYILIISTENGIYSKVLIKI